MKPPAGCASTALAVALLSYVAPAGAAPRIEISIDQAKEVVEGKGDARTVKLVPTRSALPGDVVQYTLTYTNKGDALARDAVIEDAVPKGTALVPRSAAGADAQILYS